MWGTVGNRNVLWFPAVPSGGRTSSPLWGLLSCGRLMLSEGKTTYPGWVGGWARGSHNICCLALRRHQCCVMVPTRLHNIVDLTRESLNLPVHWWGQCCVTPWVMEHQTLATCCAAPYYSMDCKSSVDKHWTLINFAFWWHAVLFSEGLKLTTLGGHLPKIDCWKENGSHSHL